jgi:hypothetical protein
MNVDWYDPADNECEDWDDSISCDWGFYGVATISGDDYGNADPNWIEIVDSQATSGNYRAEVSSTWCEDMWDCEVDEARIYLDSTLVHTLDINDDLWVPRTLCMPVVASEWAYTSFSWGSSSACD